MTTKNRKRARFHLVTRAREIRNRKGWRRKKPHGISIKVVYVRAVVWEIPIQKLWVNMKKLNSPKLEDEDNPVGGMMYQRMVDIYKAVEGKLG